MLTLADASRLPDQSGKVVVITGATSGLGRAAASALAAKGARVVIGVRDEAKGRKAAAELGAGSEARPLDLESLASVREFAAGIPGPIDLLINNAGTMTGERRQTEDGFEVQLGVNHLAHFALTNLLLERVTGRVVSVVSSAYRSARLDFDDLQWASRPYRPFGAYGQSKLAVVLFTTELNSRLAASGSPVIAAAADPGWASTGFRISSGNGFVDALSSLGTKLLAQGAENGALPTLLAATGAVPGGSLVAPSRFGGVRGPAKVTPVSAAGRDSAAAARLWELSERLTGTRFPLGTPV